MLEKVSIPEGKSGIWSVQKFVISDEEAKFDRMRASFRDGRYARAGTYTRLMRGGVLVMSDTTDEMRDHRDPVMRASGSVLINGLGLGMVLAQLF